MIFLSFGLAREPTKRERESGNEKEMGTGKKESQIGYPRIIAPCLTNPRVRKEGKERETIDES